MASIGATFTSTYHTKQLNPWPNPSANHVVNYSQLSTCQRDVQSFEGDWPSTRRHLTSHSKSSQGNFQHQYLPKLLINVYSYHLFDGEKCVLLLCVWKPAFLKYGHLFYVRVFKCTSCVQNISRYMTCSCMQFQKYYVSYLICCYKDNLSVDYLRMYIATCLNTFNGILEISLNSYKIHNIYHKSTVEN